MRQLPSCVSLLFTIAAACGGGTTSTPPPTSEADPGLPPSSLEPHDPPPAPVSPIPEGYHSVTPMLVVADVPRAIAFYTAAFGAEQTELVTDPDSNTVLHAEIRIGDSIVMLSPENERGSKAPATVNGTCGGLHVYVEDVDAAFPRAIQAGATEVAAVADMFWGDRYGQLQDPFGHRWSLATHKYEIPGEEIARRGEAWAAAMARRRRPPRFEPGTPASSYKPEGFFTVTPALVVASPDDLQFFVAGLGAEERTKMVDPRGNLVHAEIRIGDSIVMVAGETPRDRYMKPATSLGASPVSLMLYVEDVDSRFAAAIAAGGTEQSPVADMFWGDRMGIVAGAAGTVIGIATHTADLTQEEIQRRMREHQ